MPPHRRSPVDLAGLRHHADHQISPPACIQQRNAEVTPDRVSVPSNQCKSATDARCEALPQLKAFKTVCCTSVSWSSTLLRASWVHGQHMRSHQAHFQAQGYHGCRLPHS